MKTKTCKRCKADFQHKDLEQFTICEQCELEGDYATCVECEKEFFQDTDIQLCEKCMSSFDVDKLWSMHDLDQLDALDFNESATMREKFRIKK